MSSEKKQMAPDVVLVENSADEIVCDGGGGALGHPKTWYSFDGQDSVRCGYCDRLFEKKHLAPHAA